MGCLILAVNFNTNSDNWIVAYTKPRHEYSVKNQLLKKDYEVYVPTLRKRKKWSDRKKWVDFPLFQSYVFIRTEPKNSLIVLQTNGIVKIIRFGNDIAIVEDKYIIAIKRMIEGGFEPKNENYFYKGDSVVVEDGPLKGLIGEVMNESDENRLIIRIEAIQHSISVNIKKGYLKRLTK